MCHITLHSWKKSPNKILVSLFFIDLDCWVIVDVYRNSLCNYRNYLHNYQNNLHFFILFCIMVTCICVNFNIFAFSAVVAYLHHNSSVNRDWLFQMTFRKYFTKSGLKIQKWLNKKTLKSWPKIFSQEKRFLKCLIGQTISIWIKSSYF